MAYRKFLLSKKEDKYTLSSKYNDNIKIVFSKNDLLKFLYKFINKSVDDSFNCYLGSNNLVFTKNDNNGYTCQLVESENNKFYLDAISFLYYIISCIDPLDWFDYCILDIKKYKAKDLEIVFEGEKVVITYMDKTIEFTTYTLLEFVSDFAKYEEPLPDYAIKIEDEYKTNNTIRFDSQNAMFYDSLDNLIIVMPKVKFFKIIIFIYVVSLNNKVKTK